MNPGGGGRSESQSYHDIDPPPTTFNKFQSNLICLPFFPLSFLEASKKCIIIKKKDRRYHIIVLYVGSMYVWRMVTNRSRWIHSFLHYVLCTLTLLVPGHLNSYYILWWLTFSQQPWMLCGAEEACWAHNPKVVGSKPTKANLLH